jgi:uncharacterized membrane protein
MTEAPTVEVAKRSPRIRFAAIVWGAVYAIIAVSTIAIIADPMARAAVGTFLVGISVGTVILIVVIALGFLLLLSGALVMIRRGQEARRQQSAPQ